MRLKIKFSILVPIFQLKYSIKIINPKLGEFLEFEEFEFEFEELKIEFYSKIRNTVLHTLFVMKCNNSIHDNTLTYMTLSSRPSLVYENEVL